MTDMREAFEKEFPVAGGVSWNGNTYEVHEDYMNSYTADRYIGMWRAWQAAWAASKPPEGMVVVPVDELRWALCGINLVTNRLRSERRDDHGTALGNAEAAEATLRDLLAARPKGGE